ncbi:Beta-lactamase hydrolase-like protein [Alteripontixanthobacter maritimus]|uniref:Beta-lactamase hydrolase-like protein n=1 Tax=Alteripontixanthobacter maritimus TaxID=2161824 RepID=A0A369QBS1_9SPHN|nr:TIGR01244 family sulfur transferase [Alteripontixanthobacter maritimus]RDC61025.1 Beta-lactamase hydrolase-like protein [Alteripontixanthobacter maritimus]
MSDTEPDFRRLSDMMYVSPQIGLEDIAAAADRGITLIVNNRPDGEDSGQPDGAEIEAAARAAGMDYLAIPITQAGFSEAQIATFIAALAEADGPALGYCRSGTRSTFLWSLAQSQTGHAPAETAKAAADAGYDVTPIRPMMDMLAANTQNS